MPIDYGNCKKQITVKVIIVTVIEYLSICNFYIFRKKKKHSTTCATYWTIRDNSLFNTSLLSIKIKLTRGNNLLDLY